jgi:hypothetical protein
MRGAVHKVSVEDLSTNGTFLEGIKLGKGRKVELIHGAEVVLKKKILGKQKISYVYQVRPGASL